MNSATDNTDSNDLPDDIKAMSFEDALRALEAIVHQLETGEVELEQSIAIYGRGNQLKRHCEAKLKTAQARIEKIQIGTDGQPGTVPFETD